jgi:sugar (pentulose or hexulose) kinase
MIKVLVGVDAGTTSLKVSCFKIDGSCVYESSRTVTLLRPNNSAVQLDMTELWKSVLEELKLVTGQGFSPLAIGVTGQGDGAWLVDAMGNPCGPASTWLDATASEEVQLFLDDGRAADIQRVTGSSIFPGTLPLLLEHFRKTKDPRLDKAKWHLNCKDWLGFKLTGIAATDPTDASRHYLDPSTSDYSTELINQLGHQEFRQLLPPVKPSNSVRGTVTAEVARATGITTGTPVLVGVVDTAISAIGLGLTGPGETFAILGTTAVVGTLSKNKSTSTVPGRFTLGAGLNGYLTSLLAPMNGAPNIDWIIDRLKLSIEDLDTNLDNSTVGANGVIYHPYLSESGERAPFLDINASAGFFGVSAETSNQDLVRAVAEGVAFSLLESMNILGSAKKIYLTGGLSQSASWCQILADVSNVSVVRLPNAHVGLAAIAGSAGLAAGLVHSISDFTNTSDSEAFTPDPANTDLYQKIYKIFRDLRSSISPHWAELRSIKRTGI